MGTLCQFPWYDYSHVADLKLSVRVTECGVGKSWLLGAGRTQLQLLSA